MTVELLAQHLVVGLFVPTPPPGMKIQGAPEISFEKLSRIFNEVAADHNYRNFQSNPDGTAGQIVGAQVGNSINIQPPVVQFLDTVEFTPEHAAKKAEDVLKIVAKHLGSTQYFQLGVKWVFHAPVTSRDGKTFVLQNVAGVSDDDLGQLSLGGNQWVGLKYVTESVEENQQYTVLIEPLQSDLTQLFVDVDAAYPGEARLDEIQSKAEDVLGWTRRCLKPYLEKR